MKIALLFIYLLFFYIGVSQHNSIIYDVAVNDPSFKWGTVDAYEIHLQSNGQKSVEYRKDKDTLLIQGNGLIIETRDQYYNDSLTFERFKNLKNNVIEYSEYSGQVHIKDTIDIIYTVGKKNKKILDLNCSQLFFTFRGRHYEAYYTPEVPITDGPFKFIGAPGLILEVKSFDESIYIKASSITKDAIEGYGTDFKKDWFNDATYILSYNRYVEIFLNQWYDIITKIESEHQGTTSSFNSRRIEILPNKLDPEHHE